MKKRLFLAIPLPEKQIELFDKYRLNLLDYTQIRWTSEKNLHITVHFFGYEEEANIPDLSTKIKHHLKNYSSFNLYFKNISFAPDASPRMIWAIFNENKQFEELSNSIKSLGNPSRRSLNHKPIPHITLARFKRFREIKNTKLIQPVLEDMKISTINLYQSRLTPKGPIYTIIEEYNIK